MIPSFRQARLRYLTVVLGVLLLLAQPCFAAHWKGIGPARGSAPGYVYIDLDSVHEEEGYRIAVFLTIYESAVPNAHNIKIDRITQENAFDCTKREAAFRSTVGYFEGKEVGLSSAKSDDWTQRLQLVPKDPFSQRVLDMACNAPLAPQPEETPAKNDAPASVRLPIPR